MSNENTEVTVSELLPCPFCSEALMQKPAAYPLHEDYYEHPAGECILRGLMFVGQPEFIAAWNRRTIPEAAGGRVRGLEWGPPSGLGFYEATTPFGSYVIMSGLRDTTAKWWFGQQPSDAGNRRASVEEAKAAAQADYEQRIRSALE